ncbi:hypothetical protein Ahu01nite_078710 [Winogradskya humida]|uniref:Flavoprotein domain-containing protein n=1 Tax=Winogradskya humida TaxID=113566 RepID=A0ABQ4A1P1_9ACTN|nr:hypothetical protein Ahu01nite_078710 [Actinoplanes humidus]
MCIVVCGAGPAPNIGNLMALAAERGWIVNLVATPSALGFLDVAALEGTSGVEVRSGYGQRASGPRPSASDALIVAPATYNTINKLAAGINDNYALSVASEAIGRGTSTAILPFVNSALAARHPFVRAVKSLRDEGVDVLIGDGRWEPHPPGAGGQMIAGFPWVAALESISP